LADPKIFPREKEDPKQRRRGIKERARGSSALAEKEGKRGRPNVAWEIGVGRNLMARMTWVGGGVGKKGTAGQRKGAKRNSLQAAWKGNSGSGVWTRKVPGCWVIYAAGRRPRRTRYLTPVVVQKKKKGRRSDGRGIGGVRESRHAGISGHGYQKATDTKGRKAERKRKVFTQPTTTHNTTPPPKTHPHPRAGWIGLCGVLMGVACWNLSTRKSKS